ncbi:AAA family ATPase [Vineibacter terrae]|uniref:AAA family ATPase n=1 Tax=Vineibacter terrae TaxID=2586908 RepID=A0A5C8PDG7_9HYPH|nr:AAA family ATPase [Vineibacter terrae]TXL71777.1 AAA family ATPase [Vineibacter terrae]
MNKDVHDILNRYIAAELGRSFVLPDVTELSRQRSAFLAHFGPEQLAKMSGPDLLRLLPHNASNDQPMDYWLEFKNDGEFNFALFGSIAGGSAAKFGPWQEKKTGAWRSKLEGGREIPNISEADALTALEERRAELLNAVEAVGAFHGKEAKDIDPQKFQKAVEDAAPRWSKSAWMHKYLHLVFPDLVTWNATTSWSEATLYYVGEKPRWEGLYAIDIQIIRFWNSLPTLVEVPVQLRYRVGKGLIPRDHWCLGLAGEVDAWKEMLAHEHLALGPSKVGSLAEAIALNKKSDISVVVRTAFQDASLDAHSTEARNLIELVYRLEEGSLVALLSDASTVEAVGIVTGSYRFKQGAKRPHEVPVRWVHNRSFEVSTPISELGTGLVSLEPTHPAVADIEASLLVNGIGPASWPNFNSLADTPSVLLPKVVSGAAHSSGVKVDPPPPLEGIARQVVDMLDRKRQVILYGPPGTGKTYHAERIALEVIARHNFNCLPSQLSDRQRDMVYGRGGTDPFIATCTFHPMYSYEDFIEGYRPDGDGFKLEPGIFKKMVTAAQAQPAKRFVLIIDEINRGNIPKIFGELITLIETSKRATTSAMLPLSKEPFTVTDNLLVIGTMNTADRSILLLDTALRRRFAFKELLPEPHLLRTGSIADVALSTWLRAINRRIVEQLGRDGRNLQVGHAYFMSGGKPAATISRIGEIVRDELWPLLQEYCYEDPNKLANILAADRGGVFDRDTANLRFELFEPGREDALAQALTAIVTPDDKKHDAVLGDDLPDDEDLEEPHDDEGPKA